MIVHLKMNKLHKYAKSEGNLHYILRSKGTHKEMMDTKVAMGCARTHSHKNVCGCSLRETMP